MFNSFKSEPDHAPHAQKVGDAGSNHGSAFDAKLSSSGVSSAQGKSGAPNHSIVDENLTMKGDLESDGDIMIKGKVIGNITCNLLIIDRDALVEGGIIAAEVIVRGKVKGKIDADRVRLERSADIDCEVLQRSFSAEEGARIKGSLGFKTEASNVARIDAGKAADRKAGAA